ncbi:6079_t:CDS:2 [Cetraspora pellucida]|uniref:6079_t:CDS:1 n=1 Tax=Cetraspora pellucida TaxID=1433469 RepID=A0A9N8ZHL3_9GLOM|nr:6079_t:CDS:2 [Cetraspora pellucida]
MSFHSSGSERVLPPILTIDTDNIMPILPPVSSLAPSASPSLFGLKTYTQPERIQTSFESGHFHSHSNMPQHEQSYSSPRQLRNAIQVLMATPTHPHSMVSRPMHHPYQHPVYRQNDRIDPATELLAEKRRRNAGASARFRDRRKQREREMQEKCQFLERRVQELESMDSAKHIIELEKKLDEAIADKKAAQERLLEMEKELRSKLLEQEPESLTPPSSSGEYDSKDDFFNYYSRTSGLSTSSDESRKPIDVKSLLS